MRPGRGSLNQASLQLSSVLAIRMQTIVYSLMPKQNRPVPAGNNGSVGVIDQPKMRHYATSPFSHCCRKPLISPRLANSAGDKLRAWFLPQLRYNVRALALTKRTIAIEFYLIQVPEV
jgi:hypothetical protein